MREALAELLSDAGYDVTATCTADEAAILLAEGPRFELLLTDLTMPGQIDGWGLAQHARELQPSLPVVFVSGRADVHQCAAALAPPTAAFGKPFGGEQLLRELDRLTAAPAGGPAGPQPGV